MSYVVAADGGNSKTDLVVATIEGEIVAQLRGPGTTPYIDSLPSTARALAELSRLAIKQAGLNDAAQPVAGAFYIANVDLPADEESMRVQLLEHGVAADVRVRNDSFAVLAAGTDRGWGVAVVAGAGINAVGVHPDGREERFLALGDISGDWGGGPAVGMAALGAAIRAGDGRGGATTLREVVVKEFGIEPEALAIAINSRHFERDCVHRLAQGTFRAAEQGDGIARDIVHRLADEVANFATALLRRLGVVDTDVDVVLGGGQLQSGNAVLLDRVAEGVLKVAPAAQLRVLAVPPVLGALTDALVIGGAGQDAVHRARVMLHPELGPS